MKASVQSISSAGSGERVRVSTWSELFKARLTFLVLLTTLVGFYIGTKGYVSYGLMLHTVLGTAMLACGAAALNQYWEREHDAKMRRTESRPLPSGRLRPQTVLVVGGLLGGVGMIYLAVCVNLLTALLGALTLGSYLFLYTPLKRRTWLNTAVGAVPGALPPLMGWTAAGNSLTWEGGSLFAILFFWQIPHFLAIAWMYREDYARAGFIMLPSVDPDGVRTGHQAVSHTMALLFVSLCPVVFGLAGPVYFAGAVLLGGAFLLSAFLFSLQLDLRRARQLFFASIMYLPLLLVLMVLDKVKH